MDDEDPLRCPKDPAHWEARYVESSAGWDLGAAPPVLRALAPTLAPPLRVLVPGCGFGHDALCWAAAGHEVVGVDFAPSALAGATRRAAEASLDVTWLEADIFALPQYLGSFDVVWEQTCYCAIEIGRRDPYVAAMAAALREGGVFFGLFWNHGMEAGPPFDVTRDDVESRFAERFRLESIEDVTESVPTRTNEFVLRATKR